MPVKKSLSGNEFVESIPKKTYQGRGKHTKYAATSSNKPKKRYRGQGRQLRGLIRVLFYWVILNDFSCTTYLNQKKVETKVAT